MARNEANCAKDSAHRRASQTRLGTAPFVASNKYKERCFVRQRTIVWMQGCDNAHARRNACQIMADSRRREMFMTWLDDSIPFHSIHGLHSPIYTSLAVAPLRRGRRFPSSPGIMDVTKWLSRFTALKSHVFTWARTRLRY
jgi:hypothetical protein